MSRRNAVDRASQEPGRARGDRGASFVLFTILMVPVLILTAIVVDLGLGKVTRSHLKAATDMAAIAAGFFLAGDGSASPVSNPQLACGAALASLKTNLGDLPSSASLSPSCSQNFPANALNCSNDQPEKQTSVYDSPPYRVTIEYPVPAADLADGRFVDGVGTDDGLSPCARMRVSVTRTNAALFGSVIGSRGLSIDASSVVRAGLSPNGVAAPAILLLERNNCGSLTASGQGGVRVRGAVTSGGWIHADTAAGGVGSIGSSNCQGGTSCSANNYSIVGSNLPASAGGGPSIIAESSDASVGRIGTYALFPRIGGAGGCTYPTGLNVPVTADPIVSRTPVDLRFNSPYNAAGAALSELHQTGYWATTHAAPAGYQVVSGQACNRDGVVWKAAKVFVDCPNGFSGKNVVFRGTHITFTGPLNVSGGYVAFPNAKELLVRGCTTCARGIYVSSGGRLSVNTGEAVSGKFNLTAALNAAADGSPNGAPATWPAVNCLVDRAQAPNATTLASFAGSFSIQNATTNLCQTFVYLGDDKASYTQASKTVEGNCSVALPCPASTPPTKPIFDLNSGSQPAMSWTAPVQNLSGPSATSPFDGLALWTEGGLTCSIGGQGALTTSGVFFFPNCNFAYAGQANADIPLAAQFIGRSLTMSGQGVLSLQPDPKRSIAVASPGTVQLIR